MTEEENIVLLCEDSLEGIFTGIYEAYALKKPHDGISLQITGEGDMLLFSTYRTVPPDSVKTEKVIRTLRSRFGDKDYFALCLAAASALPDKAQAIYKTVVWGLSGRCRGSILDHLADDNVRRTLELSRGAGNELHRMKEFLRFSELEGGVLYAVIGPKDNVLPMLTVHFADRLPMENFVICDENRRLYAIHPAGKEWFLMRGQDTPLRAGEEGLKTTAEEEHYQELFRHFCHKISIEGRKNLKLQQNMLPLRFRNYMVEFVEK